MQQTQPTRKVRYANLSGQGVPKQSIWDKLCGKPAPTTARTFNIGMNAEDTRKCPVNIPRILLEIKSIIIPRSSLSSFTINSNTFSICTFNHLYFSIRSIFAGHVYFTNVVPVGLSSGHYNSQGSL